MSKSKETLAGSHRRSRTPRRRFSDASDTQSVDDKRFASFFNEFPGFAWMKDIEGRYVHANCSVQSMKEFREGWLGKTDDDVFPPEIAAIFREHDKKVITTKKPLETVEPYLVDGERHLAIVSKFPIFDAAGEVILVGGLSVEVRNYAENEERLREYERAIEDVEEMIAVVDRNYRYTVANNAFALHRGLPAEEIVGRFVSEILDAETFASIVKPQLDEAFAGTSVTFETQHEYPSLGLRELMVSYFPIEGPHCIDRVVCIIRDITERKRTQQALRTYARRLIEAQEAERQNVARELHDEIGQVLTAVRLSLHSIQVSCQTRACQPNIDESIQVVDDALKRVRELSLELRPSLLDDLGLIAAVRWYAGRYTERSGIAVDVIADDDIGRISHEVETACFRITQEALTNTARHAQARRAVVRVRGLNGTLRLTVRDDGIGFDAHQLLNGTSSSMALGLHGMRERALAVKGEVQIQSGPGRGTTVTISVPTRA